MLILAEWMMDSSRFKFWFKCVLVSLFPLPSKNGELTAFFFPCSFSDGDKDMFRYAMLALRKRWGVPGRYVSVGALPRNTMSGFCKYFSPLPRSTQY